MTKNSLQMNDKVLVKRENLDQLFDALAKRGFSVIGPTVEDNAIIYDEIEKSADLPVGLADEQSGGTYRLKKRKDSALFGYVVGPHSWKKFLHPPNVRLWKAKKTKDGFEIENEKKEAPKFAFIGARSCEINAIAIQDKVFMGGDFVDPTYQANRSGLFLVAVQCGQSASTCFCVSMKTGPKATKGFDLALTEIIEDGDHYFLFEIGSPAGAEVAAEIEHRSADETTAQKAEEIVEKTAREMTKSLDTTGIKELLYRNNDNKRWEEVANRCLSCANCTMVCPTCFCTTVEEVTDLTGDHAERWRKWDSCFTMDFSYIHGGSVRSKTKSQYRQWMTHKLATWWDQFDSTGCVGCGRCITWCPVGIDLTEETAAIRESDLKEVQNGNS